MPCEEVIMGHRYSNDVYGGVYQVDGLKPDMTYFEKTQTVGRRVIYIQQYDGEMFPEGTVHERLEPDFQANFTELNER